MDEITRFITYTSTISPIIPIALFISSKSFCSRYVNTLALLLLISFLCDICSIFLSVQGKANYVIANVYSIAEFLLISLIYMDIFKYISRLYHGFLVIVGSGVILINSLFGQGFDSIQSITWGSSCFLMAAMAFGHFTYILKHPVIKLRSFAPYWITMGLLFYCSSTYLILAFSHVLTRNLDTQNFSIIWSVHNINNIIKNIFFLFAIFWAPRREAFLQVFNSGQN